MLRPIIDAFEESLAALGLKDREDPLTLMVAQRIIELAKEGERDANKLCDIAVETFRK
jgi:hypothetical protein